MFISDVTCFYQHSTVHYISQSFANIHNTGERALPIVVFSYFSHIEAAANIRNRFFPFRIIELFGHNEKNMPAVRGGTTIIITHYNNQALSEMSQWEEEE